MNLSIKFLISLGTFLFIQTLGAAEKVVPEGQQIFTKYKCAQCHSIKSVGIEVDESLAEEGEEAEAEDPEAPKPPDMGEIDPKRDPGVKHSKKWTSKFLQKKVAIGERYHTKRFKGSKEERKTLINWLFKLRK